MKRPNKNVKRLRSRGSAARDMTPAHGDTTPSIQRTELVREWVTPLFFVNFDGVEAMNRDLSAAILRKEDTFAKLTRPVKATPQYWSRFSSFHYRQDLFSWRGRAIQRLREMVLSAVDQFANQYLEGQELRVTRLAAWANVNRAGDWNGPHNHFGGEQCLSGVYWVSPGHEPSDMFDLDGNLVFLDPRGYGYPARYDVVVAPKAGQMVLQPSWLAHLVTPRRSTGLRISIAFDVFVERNPWWNLKGHIRPTGASL